jgi:SAM-dependent methyltransferase
LSVGFLGFDRSLWRRKLKSIIVVVEPSSGRHGGFGMSTKSVADCWEGNAENWTKYSRAGYDVYRDALNTPAFLDLLPPVQGLSGLDLGCGEGTNTRAVARLGAQMTGLDISSTFIRHAHETEERDPLGVRYVVGDAQVIDFPDETFDFVTAFMSMMDMADPRKVLPGVRRVLKPGGFLQFSILHPCFVPPTRRNIRDDKGEAIAVQVADYFDETDGRIEYWTLSAIPENERAGITPFAVPRFHRTLSSWVDIIVDSGLTIEAFGEPRASDEVARAVPIVADTQVAPIFLHIRARKA